MLAIQKRLMYTMSMNESHTLYTKLSSSPFIISGPCVLESYDIAMHCIDALLNAVQGKNIVPIFKASFDKANRTSITGFRGIGIEKSLAIFERIKKETGIPILTDVHEESQVEQVLNYIDIIQIPALLCRQTSLLLSAGKSGAIVNIKKGQFLSPLEVLPLIEKVHSTGNTYTFITERGTCFGYNTLVVDFRFFVEMQEHKIPTIFDATHSVQQPGSLGTCSGGKRKYVPALVRSAIACGVQGIFMECHPNPDKALCDGPNSIPTDWLAPICADADTLWNMNYETRSL